MLENIICNSKSMLLLSNTFEKLYNLWHFGDFSDKIRCKALVYEIYAKLTKQILSEYVSPIKKDNA